MLLHRRPEEGLLGGMMELPSTEWALAPGQAAIAAPLRGGMAALSRVRIEHCFTHFHLVLISARLRRVAGESWPEATIAG